MSRRQGTLFARKKPANQIGAARSRLLVGARIASVVAVAVFGLVSGAGDRAGPAKKWFEHSRPSGPRQRGQSPLVADGSDGGAGVGAFCGHDGHQFRQNRSGLVHHPPSFGHAAGPPHDGDHRSGHHFDRICHAARRTADFQSDRQSIANEKWEFLR